ncbi:MAG TPA: hypothetical protein VLT85_13225 [Terriglobales bacterium]|nr:hypothetical protein [Terriglobales bacterium]
MPARHSRATIVSVAVVSIGLAALLHEGLGHGVTAWLRGDLVTELTSNHLSSLRPDRMVEAGGTIVNLIIGAICLALSHGAGKRADARYFLWFFAAVNLLQGAGYFLFSGLFGVGDWNAVIAGLAHPAALRAAMALLGAVLYVVCVRRLAVALRPFVATHAEYNTLARLPYLAACVFYCIAGAFDPLGVRLLLLSTIPAAFGGISGLLWADVFLPRTTPTQPLAIKASSAWVWTAIVFGGAFVVVLGRGIEFKP